MEIAAVLVLYSEASCLVDQGQFYILIESSSQGIVKGILHDIDTIDRSSSSSIHNATHVLDPFSYEKK